MDSRSYKLLLLVILLVSCSTTGVSQPDSAINQVRELGISISVPVEYLLQGMRFDPKVDVPSYAISYHSGNDVFNKYIKVEYIKHYYTKFMKKLPATIYYLSPDSIYGNPTIYPSDSSSFSCANRQKDTRIGCSAGIEWRKRFGTFQWSNSIALSGGIDWLHKGIVIEEGDIINYDPHKIKQIKLQEESTTILSMGLEYSTGIHHKITSRLCIVPVIYLRYEHYYGEDIYKSISYDLYKSAFSSNDVNNLLFRFDILIHLSL